MAPDPGKELAVAWRDLEAAGRVCDTEARRLTGPITSFEVDAYGARRTFGLIEDGADELYESYQQFFTETCGFLHDLKEGLDDAATRLLGTSRVYRDADPA